MYQKPLRHPPRLVLQQLINQVTDLRHSGSLYLCRAKTRVTSGRPLLHDDVIVIGLYSY